MDEEMLAKLLRLLDHPIDLNGASIADLEQIPFVSPSLATAIVIFRDSAGTIENLDNLSNIPFVTPQILARIQPFVVLHSTNTSIEKNQARAFDLTLVQSFGSKLDLPSGFNKSPEEGGFHGSPASLYTRWEVNWTDKLSLRLVTEKDAGESFVGHATDNFIGSDHLTGGLQFNGRRILKNAILGDYSITIGQGLMFWRSTGRGKGTAPTEDPIRQAAGIRPMASREEHAFFRGGAITLYPLPQFIVRAFVSRRTLDATLEYAALETQLINEEPAPHQKIVRTLVKHGMHRTISEIERKDVLKEEMLGGTMAYRRSNWELELAGYNSFFSHPFEPDQKPSKHHSFRGSRLSGLSINGKAALGKTLIFGEYASSVPGGQAFISGLRFSSYKTLDAVFSWRYFEPDYIAQHGNAFSETRTVGNEQGFYLGSQFSLGTRWRAGFYIDLYRHPWLKSTVSSPSSGVELFGSLIYNPRKWLVVSGSYRHEQSEANIVSLSVFNQLLKSSTRRKKEVFRIQLDYIFSSHLKLRSRIEVRRTHANNTLSFGVLSLQDVAWTPSKKLSVHARVALFDSEGGSTTLYAYENDLRYRFTIRTMTGTGARNFILLRKRLGTHFIFEVKYGTTRYGSLVTKGAGADSFSGTLVREFNTQIIWNI